MPPVALRHIIMTMVLLAKPTMHGLCKSVNLCHTSCLVTVIPNIFSTFRAPFLAGPLRSEGTEGGRYASACRGPGRNIKNSGARNIERDP